MQITPSNAEADDRSDVSQDPHDGKISLLSFCLGVSPNPITGTTSPGFLGLDLMLASSILKTGIEGIPTTNLVTTNYTLSTTAVAATL